LLNPADNFLFVVSRQAFIESSYEPEEIRNPRFQDPKSRGPVSLSETTPAVTLAIPCYNEAAAISAVITEWQVILPYAEIIVYDNNSDDDTSGIAKSLGVKVVPVPEQGKGHVVRAIFRDLADRDAVILIDGDGTYPAEPIDLLLSPVLTGQAEMAVGIREPVVEAGAMSPLRGLGNLLIGAAFRLLIGRGTSDLLSGYRVFSKTFINTVQLRSEGFEIETELASEAVARGLRTIEVPVTYLPRIEGSHSKLRAFRDGLRILRMILRQGVRLRPWRLLTLVLLLLGFLGLGLALLLLRP
jgi:glycosyltransferase involved in cell wall biosynthesis